MAPAPPSQEESFDELVAILLGAAIPPPAAFIKPAMLVTLTVQDTQRRTVVRTMRRTDELRDLMDYYLDVVGLADGGVGRFVFDGRRVKREHTPEDLKMENGDQIDYFETRTSCVADDDVLTEGSDDEGWSPAARRRCD